MASVTNHLHVLLCFGSSRTSGEAGGEPPLRPVAALVRSGLRTAVARLAREQEERERHQEAVGKVRLSAAARPRPQFFFNYCIYVLIRIRRSQSGSPAQGHDPELGEFKRGGFRATAGPRLARSGITR